MQLLRLRVSAGRAAFLQAALDFLAGRSATLHAIFTVCFGLKIFLWLIFIYFYRAWRPRAMSLWTTRLQQQRQTRFARSLIFSIA
jgi:hypothetical protein